MFVQALGNISDKKEMLKKLGVDSGALSILADKMELLYFHIKDLRTPAVNILKQDALSIGAELAVPSGVITCDEDTFDCILIGTRKHIKILSKKELSQPFGLKSVAYELVNFLKKHNHSIQIMGVVNANDDSFYAASRFLANDAVSAIVLMIEQGASIIDIGAVSSRPGADIIDESTELARIAPICDAIKDRELYSEAIFSIDSYTPSVIEYALKSGFGIINDITGARDDEVIRMAVEYSSKLCIMHMQGTPQTMQENPSYHDVMFEVSEFFENQIEKCEKFGMSREDIILDVGIGFGKSLDHNITLIKNMNHFRRFGCQVLVGVSRKSMIDHISPSPIEQRLAGTLAIHLKAIENGANIVRCHDVYEHKQALDIWNTL